MRGFGLEFSLDESLGEVMPRGSLELINALSQSFAMNSVDIDNMATLIVSIIGTGEDRNLCMKNLKKLFQILRSYYYPSNTGAWVVNSI